MGVNGENNKLLLLTAGLGGKGEDTITSKDFHHVSKKLSNNDETVAIIDYSWIAQNLGRISSDTVGAVIKILFALDTMLFQLLILAKSIMQRE